MTGILTTNGMIRALAATNGDIDAGESLYFRPSGDHNTVDAYTLCSDFFAHGCSDAEDITDDTLDVFVAAMSAVRAAGTSNPTVWGSLLYAACCRHREPTAARWRQIDDMHPELRPLFEAAATGAPIQPQGDPEPVAAPKLIAHLEPALSRENLCRVLMGHGRAADPPDFAWHIPAVAVEEGPVVLAALSYGVFDNPDDENPGVEAVTDDNVDLFLDIMRECREAGPHNDLWISDMFVTCVRADR